MISFSDLSFENRSVDDYHPIQALAVQPGNYFVYTSLIMRQAFLSLQIVPIPLTILRALSVLARVPLSVLALVVLLGTGGGPVCAEPADAVAPVFQEGDRALDLGDYTRAESIFSDGLKRSPKDDAARAQLQIGLAESLLNQGRFSDAAKEYKRAQVLIDRNAKSALRARLYDGLSWLHHAQGKLDAAVEDLKTALNIRQSLANPDDLLIVSTLTHMGQLLELQGKLEESTKFYKQALETQEKMAGQTTIAAADLKQKLGQIARRLGDIKMADQFLSEALNFKLSTGACLSAYAPHPYWENVTYDFMEGAPNCARGFAQGSTQEIITANGVTVSTSLSSLASTKSAQVNVTVRNDSGRDVQFLPIPPSLIITQPKIVMAPQVDPAKLAESIEKKGDRKAAWIRFWGQDATRPITTTYMGQPGFFGYPPIYSYGGARPFVNRSGNMTIVTTQVPDYAAQARALAKAAAVSSDAHQKAGYIKTSGLGPMTIANGQQISGSLFFDAPKISQAIVRVPIGNGVFEFEFPPR